MRATIPLVGCGYGFLIDCQKSTGTTTSLEFDMAEVNSFDFTLSGNVIVTKGVTQHVTIDGPEDVILDINTDVSNGHWEIATRKCFRKYDPLTVIIQLPALIDVTLSGAGSIDVRDTFNTTTSKVVLSGSGNVSWKSVTEKMEANIIGSGNITMTGEAHDFFGSISGSGNIHARNFPANQVDITVAGSGNTEVTVYESLKARIGGSGSVFYYGNPESISQSISWPGKLVKRI